MHKEMRLKNRQLDEQQARAILTSASYGVLSTVSEDGTPYGVPLNHVVAGDKLYFHCAVTGHKLDNLRHNANACFTVVSAAQMCPERITTEFESVIVFGTVRILQEPDEIAHATRLLCEKNMPEHMAMAESAIAGALSKLSALELTIERLTGKSNIKR